MSLATGSGIAGRAVKQGLQGCLRVGVVSTKVDWSYLCRGFAPFRTDAPGHLGDRLRPRRSAPNTRGRIATVTRAVAGKPSSSLPARDLVGSCQRSPTTPDLVDLTRQSIDALNRGRLFGVDLSPEVVLDTAGYGMGTFNGLEAAAGFLSEWTSSVRGPDHRAR